MTPKLLAMMNESEQALLREVEPKRLRKLDEDALIDLHTRIRRARTKYTKLYRRRAAAQVGSKGARSGASAGNSKTRHKAEIFEAALSTVSTRLAAVAHEQAEALKVERLAAAKGQRKGAAKGTASSSKGKRKSKSGATRGDGALKSPVRKRNAASQRSAKRRHQAKRG
jgi:hypothetical protein